MQTMSNDLFLSPDTHDLRIENNDLSIVLGAERVRQQLACKLKLWREEWFLDTEFGTPYLQSILGKQITLNGAIAAIRLSILEVADVRSITSFTYNFIRSERRLEVEFECDTPFGIIRMTL